MPRTLDESAGDLLTAMGAVSRGAQGPTALAIGTVTSGLQEGLRVQCGGTKLTAADIWINDGLLAGYRPALAVGDRVVLLTQDEQVYYLLCKVVKPA